eukprot:2466072-Karenia_brevis.AAC.1
MISLSRIGVQVSFYRLRKMCWPPVMLTILASEGMIKNMLIKSFMIASYTLRNLVLHYMKLKRQRPQQHSLVLSSTILWCATDAV